MVIGNGFLIRAIVCFDKFYNTLFLCLYVSNGLDVKKILKCSILHTILLCRSMILFPSTSLLIDHSLNLFPSLSTHAPKCTNTRNTYIHEINTNLKYAQTNLPSDSFLSPLLSSPTSHHTHHWLTKPI